jgi:hypothetical protein
MDRPTALDSVALIEGTVSFASQARKNDAPPTAALPAGARAGMGKAMEPEKKIRLTSFSHGAG